MRYSYTIITVVESSSYMEINICLTFKCAKLTSIDVIPSKNQALCEYYTHLNTLMSLKHY